MLAGVRQMLAGVRQMLAGVRQELLRSANNSASFDARENTS